jgi:hypothetical protein
MPRKGEAFRARHCPMFLVENAVVFHLKAILISHRQRGTLPESTKKAALSPRIARTVAPGGNIRHAAFERSGWCRF